MELWNPDTRRLFLRHTVSLCELYEHSFLRN